MTNKLNIGRLENAQVDMAFGGNWQSSFLTPPTPPYVPGTSIDPMTDASSWANGSGTQVRTNLAAGAGMHVVGSSNATSFSKNLNVNMTDRAISFQIRWVSNFYRLTVFMMQGTTSFGVSRWSSAQVYGTEFTQNEWGTVTLPLIDFDAGGSAPPIAFNDIRSFIIQIERLDAGLDVIVDFADLRHHDQTLTDGPGVIWVFDDSRLDSYTFVKPLLDAIGHVGVLPTPTNLMGGVSLGDGHTTMSWDQLHEMADAGWQVCAHGHNHINLQAASSEVIVAEMTSAFATLLDHGFDPEGARHYVYPGGGYTDAVVDQLFSSGYVTGRSTNNKKKGEIPEVGNLGRLSTLYVQSATTLAQVTDVMDRLAARGGISIISLHSFEDNPGETWNWWPDRFEAAVAHAGTLGLASYTLPDLYPV